VKRILIENAYPEEKRIVVLSEDRVTQFDLELSHTTQKKSNIYLAKVVRIEPALQAAFVEFEAGGKQGFLPFHEIHPDYYRIGSEDRQEWIQAAQKEVVFEESEDETVSVKWQQKHLSRSYRIQNVLSKGQILLVQVTKDARGKKGPALTTYLALSGKYGIFLPNSLKKTSGISKKIQEPTVRKKLRKFLDQWEAQAGELSLILRSASADTSSAEIKRDFEYLKRLWNTVRNKAMLGIAPSLVHTEGNSVVRAIRDWYKRDIQEVWIEGESDYKQARHVMKLLMPSHFKRIKLYKDDIPLFQKFNVESQLDEMYQSRVTLPSGGSLVIHPTEALVSIDVNSGKSMSESNLDETAFKTNLEASIEIARQLRLRDLSGLIVIDFIDMHREKHQQAVEQSLKQALKSDKAKIRLGKISSFGLLEMSRQRLRGSFLEAQAHPCTTCQGHGFIFSHQAAILRLMRRLDAFLREEKSQSYHVFVPHVLLLSLLNERRKEIAALELQHQTSLVFVPDRQMGLSEFRAQAVVPSVEISDLDETSSLRPSNAKNHSKNHSKKPVSKDPSLMIEARLQAEKPNLLPENKQNMDAPDLVLEDHKKKPHSGHQQNPSKQKLMLKDQSQKKNTNTQHPGFSVSTQKKKSYSHAQENVDPKDLVTQESSLGSHNLADPEHSSVSLKKALASESFKTPLISKKRKKNQHSNPSRPPVVSSIDHQIENISSRSSQELRNENSLGMQRSKKRASFVKNLEHAQRKADPVENHNPSIMDETSKVLRESREQNNPLRHRRFQRSQRESQPDFLTPESNIIHSKETEETAMVLENRFQKSSDSSPQDSKQMHPKTKRRFLPRRSKNKGSSSAS